MENKERFLSLCSKIERAGINDLLDWLEKSDFYTCPASTKFHDVCAGGLLQHSLNVYDELKRLLTVYSVKVNEESIIIVSLFHDLCKVNFYTTEKRNRKNTAGKWESYDAFAVKEKFCYGGHGSKSVFLVQNFMRLLPEEAVAINCHMGAWEDTRYVGAAYEQLPLAWLVHVADEAATYMKR